MNGHSPNNDSTQPGPTPNDRRAVPPMRTKRRRTAAEQQIVDVLAKTHGGEYAERHAELAIEQAKSASELPDFDVDCRMTRLVAGSPTLSEFSC